MEKKSVLKSIIAKPAYENSFGKSYPFDCEFENGDKGMISTKKEEAPYVVGKEYTYDITEETSAKGNKWFKIKKVDPNAKKFFDNKVKLRSFALKYATRMVTGGVIERPEDLENETDDNWNLFTARVQKSAKLYYKLMMDDAFKYGDDNVDAIGTAMSQAIDLVVEKKIDKNKMLIFYTRLIESILVAKLPQTEQK